MKYDYLDEAKKFALANCKTLYRDLHSPCTETTMCWGWEFGKGWNNVVKELSVKLEMLNMMFYPKYGVRVIMDQTKEKFGMLTCYYHVEIESPFIYRMWSIPFERTYRFLHRNIDYKMKRVVDEKSYESDEWTEVDNSNIDEEKRQYVNVSNVKFEEKDGKTYRVTKVFHCEKCHNEPTVHKFLFKIQNIAYRLWCAFDFSKEPTAEQLVIQNAVDSIASQYINEAEKKCYDVCEDCGNQIGTKYSKRVCTKGWISYICEECNTDREFHKNIESVKYGIPKTEDAKKLQQTAINYENRYNELKNSNKYVEYSEFKKLAKKAENLCNKFFEKELVK